MFSSRPSAIVLLLLASALSADGQEEQSYVVWGASSTCGVKRLPPASHVVECSQSLAKDLAAYQVKHGKLSIAMKYWWYASHIRIWIEVENGYDESIPVDIKSWSVAGYGSSAAFNAKEKALFLSEAESARDGIARMGRGGVGVPVVVGGNLPDGGGDPARSIAPIPTVAENKRPSAMKWKELRPRSRQSGEVRFDTDPKARYLRITFNLSGVHYIYPLEKP